MKKRLISFIMRNKKIDKSISIKINNIALNLNAIEMKNFT